jgi:hypothetical protein
MSTFFAKNSRINRRGKTIKNRGLIAFETLCESHGQIPTPRNGQWLFLEGRHLIPCIDKIHFIFMAESSQQTANKIARARFARRFQAFLDAQCFFHCKHLFFIFY